MGRNKPMNRLQVIQRNFLDNLAQALSGLEEPGPSQPSPLPSLGESSGTGGPLPVPVEGV